MKHLIVCCDGTWNTLAQREFGLPAPTNVVKFHNALAAADRNGDRQMKYYHPGIGTEGGFWERYTGGAFGSGLDRHVRAAYQWLAMNYEPGDRIYLIGFSRGAYTARSVGGMISRRGLLNLRGMEWNAGEQQVERVFRAYRETAELRDDDLLFNNLDEDGRAAGNTPIRLIGVWDTVGSLGIPLELSITKRLVDHNANRFHDTTLGLCVEHARHAVALDEIRQTFAPTLWKENGKTDLRQLWFPGVHGDVGGGYSRCDLSDGTLLWMMREAADVGLAFRWDPHTDHSQPGARLRPDPRGVLHDSVEGYFKNRRTRPRAVPDMGSETRDSVFHDSAVTRHLDPALDQETYWETRTADPSGAIRSDIFARDPWNPTGVFLRAGVEYEFAARGEWFDDGIRADPAGKVLGGSLWQRAVREAGTAFGLAERLASAIFGPHTDWPYTRRQEDLPWMALVGLVANGVTLGGKTTAQENMPWHEIFLIGTSTRFTPKEDGYLYCFANDAWNTHGNNHGAVELTVRKLS